MISWRTTVAPATTSSRSSRVSESFDALDFQGTASFTAYNKTTLFTSANWSETTYATTDDINAGATSTFYSNSGTGTNYASFTTSESGGETSVYFTETVETLTVTRNVETSTTATINFEKATTTATTRNIVRRSTSENESQSYVYTYLVTTTAVTAATVNSTSLQTITTTNSETELDPSFYATIYQTNQINEVLWCLNSYSELPFDGAFTAASALATSLTRWTAMPDTRVTGKSVVDASVSATSTAPALSSVFTISEVVGELGESSQVVDRGQLPWVTANGGAFIGALAVTQTSITAFESQSIVAAKIAQQTRYAQFATTRQDVFGNGFELVGISTMPAWASSPRLTSDTNIATTSSTAYTTGNLSLTVSVENGANGFPLKAQGLATSVGNYFSKLIGLEGAAQNATSIGGYYNSPWSFSIDFGQEYLARLNRSIGFNWFNFGWLSIMPSTFNIIAETATGTVSFSNLSATATYVTGATSPASTTSFVMSAQENAATVLRAHAAGFGGTLAFGESAATTIAPGVYRKYEGSNSGTFSTTGGAGSYSGEDGGPTHSLEPLSFLVPEGDAAPLVWTATRN